MRSLRLLLVFVLAACGGGDSTGPETNGDDFGFTAKVDGVAWNPQFEPAAANMLPGLYTITGMRATGANAYTIVLNLYNISGPGTYRLGVNAMMLGGTGLVSQAPSSGWSTPLSGRAGSVTITTLTPTRIAGTFEFVAEGQPGTTGTRTVTDGEFDLEVTGTGGPASAEKGSVFTADIGGEVFHGGTLAWTLAGSTFSLSVNDGTRTLNILLGEVSGGGTYGLSATPLRRITLSGVPAENSIWNSNLTGGGGSVTLTMQEGRIDGSFTATLIGETAAVGSVEVSGTFSLGD